MVHAAVLYELDGHRIDTDRLELLQGEGRIAVEPQVLDLLLYLVRNRHRVISKEELIEQVWRGRIVSDSTLTSRIATARKVIGDSGSEQRQIRTVARRGLRFVGAVRELDAAETGTDGAPGVDHASVLAALFGAGPLPLPDKPSIAVLPLVDLPAHPGQAYFSEGLTEEIITALGRVRWLFVVARNSAFAYRGIGQEVRCVGEELGVRYVLAGSVRRNGRRMRLSMRLMEAATGQALWAEGYDREPGDIFALQEDIARRVAAAIEPSLLCAEGLRTQARAVGALDEWELLARALSHFWKLSAAGSEAAIAVLEQAIARHPGYAPPHSLLAFALLVAGHMGWRRCPDDRARAELLAQRALGLDDGDPWVHMALGYLAFIARQPDEAVEHFAIATRNNPSFAAGHGYAGWAQAHDGRSETAIANLQRAVRLSPRDPFNVFYMAGFAAAHYTAGRYPQAAQWARRALRMRPAHLGARRKLCASLAMAGQVDEARQELAELRRLQPDLSLAWIEQAVPYTGNQMAHFLEGMRKAGLT